MTLQVTVAVQTLGECADGQRSNYPILGGRFEGAATGGQVLRGEVLPGGADFYRQRADGVGELDARYSLRTEQGELINIHNTGLIVMSEQGQALEAQGLWPIDEAHYRCTCTPRFQVPRGRLDGLGQGTFIGRAVYPTADQVVIHCYRLA
ncbi:DUF3237 domain-containing protein [Pseudomonas sp. 3A(2025)]